jgi:L-alanine-DL-glutamate epimerase-like enolase superfamily enzyme
MTTIQRLAVAVYEVPTPEPESDGTLTWESTTVVLAEPSAGDATGLGFTYHSAACADVIDRTLRPVVVGADCFDVPAVWSRMVAEIRNYGRPGVVSAAIAAVDIALWDLKAKLLDVPLVSLLGAVSDSAPVYGSGGFTSYTDEKLADELSGWVRRDAIPRVKMKIGSGWGREPGRDLQRVAAVRTVIGDEPELFVDANGAYSRKQAARLAVELEDCGVSWFEEPVSSDDLEGLRLVRDLSHLDVAAGEYGSDLAYFHHMCAAGAVDVLQADVTRCAGITEWLRIASSAAGHGLQISGHCAQSLHVHPACAVPNLRHLEYFVDHARVDRLLFDGVLDPHGGVLEPDRSRPGLGLSKRYDTDRYRIR